MLKTTPWAAPTLRQTESELDELSLSIRLIATAQLRVIWGLRVLNNEGVMFLYDN